MNLANCAKLLLVGLITVLCLTVEVAGRYRHRRHRHHRQAGHGVNPQHHQKVVGLPQPDVLAIAHGIHHRVNRTIHAKRGFALTGPGQNPSTTLRPQLTTIASQASTKGVVNSGKNANGLKPEVKQVPPSSSTPATSKIETKKATVKQVPATSSQKPVILKEEPQGMPVLVNDITLMRHELKDNPRAPVESPVFVQDFVGLQAQQQPARQVIPIARPQERPVIQFDPISDPDTDPFDPLPLLGELKITGPQSPSEYHHGPPAADQNRPTNYIPNQSDGNPNLVQSYVVEDNSFHSGMHSDYASPPQESFRYFDDAHMVAVNAQEARNIPHSYSYQNDHGLSPEFGNTHDNARSHGFPPYAFQEQHETHEQRAQSISKQLHPVTGLLIFCRIFSRILQHCKL